MSSSNVKVKRAATTTFGRFHTQLGASFKALCLSLNKNASLNEALLKCFEAHPFDSTNRSVVRQKSSLATKLTGSSGFASTGFQVPKANLSETLAPDIMSRLVRFHSVRFNCNPNAFVKELQGRQGVVEKEERGSG